MGLVTAKHTRNAVPDWLLLSGRPIGGHVQCVSTNIVAVGLRPAQSSDTTTNGPLNLIDKINISRLIKVFSNTIS